MKLFLPVLLIFVSSCAGLKFNQRAQEQNLKVKTLTEQTIEQSVKDYSPTAAEDLAKAYKSAIAFEQLRGKTNGPTISMWKQVDAWINIEFSGTWEE